MKGSAESPHSKCPHVYAIVRFDLYVDPSSEHSATVVKVLSSPELAEQEAERLRQVNKDKDCTYVVQTTRFVGKADA